MRHEAECIVTVLDRSLARDDGGEFRFDLSNSERMYVRDLAARCARALRRCSPSQTTRGRREDRVHAAPEISCANRTNKNAHEHTGSAEAFRPSLRSGFTAYNALSPVTGFLATVISRISSANLTPASGRQNHTTSPYASRAFVFRACRVHRISPRVRDVRTPLSSGETRGVMPLICPTR